MPDHVKKQGLYDPLNEKDSCGIGFVASIKGVASHQIVKDGLQILENLEHRGATGCEPNTGDGAGILMQISHKFFSKVTKALKISLPEKGRYGIGMIYLPPNESQSKAIRSEFEKIVSAEGQKVLGWREAPTNNTSLGDTAKSSEPKVFQVFIEANANIKGLLDFERKLYVIRKKAENKIRYAEKHVPGGEFFYVSSLSYKTIVYKGMLMCEQVGQFFDDLRDPDMESAIAVVHSRFSTNTFPSWERAHPYRYLIHNGEINTLRGNINWMHAREMMIKTDIFDQDLKNILPVVQPDGSDSQMFDNVLEFLVLAGRPLPHVMMMMIPEPWQGYTNMDPTKRAFYEYHASLMEPWDGPASMATTDGEIICASLDRNGLRPSRYYVTKDDRVILGSEVGVLNVAPEDVVYKGRLQPGRMLVIDTNQKRIISDEEIKMQFAKEKPYSEWLKNNLMHIDDLPQNAKVAEPDHETVLQRQQAFGYTFEDINMLIQPMAATGVEGLGSMGTDTPLAVLSEKPQMLYFYFKQLFAQVTNPPIDCIREEIVTSMATTIGPEQDLLHPTEKSCHQIKLNQPVISNEELAKLKDIKVSGYKSVVLPILYKISGHEKALENAIEDLFKAADKAIDSGSNIIILSDRGINAEYAAIPALLAVSGLHHHLIRNGKRTKIGMVLESGEPREVHHFSLLIGYGVGAVNPYLAFETIDDMIKGGILKLPYDKAVKNFIKASAKGVVKVISKMGISTIQSYCGAQIFEALGLSQKLVDRYFTWTPTRIEGIGIEELAKEVEMRHNKAFKEPRYHVLEAGGQYKWRKDGEYHLFNPETIHKLQVASRTNNLEFYKQYAELINNQSQHLCTLRGLMELQFSDKAIPIEEVESVESICKRFKSGAMSYGSISKEAHESLAIAMNRIGGKSNTGEGGEDPERFKPMANGDSKNSAIKQVASGRFGVTINYLVNAKEIQIKMAQGAKPGEGGQLPGSKVYPWIAKVRHATPGVGLISPPPHHDIYSIEDLAELIHDLKNANRDARINVKLVSEVGVGTIAAGVAKGKADVVLISGYDGGTGASPLTSIKHAGLPWELGLAETHQTLLLNNLRSRIVVETDGQLKTGRDVVIAALLGAEEYGFATAPLVTLGCILMRVCHLDTCPVGVATQNPELRKKFTGDPASVVNFLKFVAQDVREIMAKLGFRTIDEMIGRTDKIEFKKAVNHWKSHGLDFSKILYRPDVPKGVGTYCTMKQDHGIERSLDMTKLLDICKPAIDKKEKVKAEVAIRNINRVTGTIVGSEIAKKHGEAGLPEDTIQITFKGSAGQSFGAFMPNGMTFRLEGDANDYVGKGLSGGKIIVYPPKNSSFVAEENMIIGNVAFYGATRGEAYLRGMAGERFCVRNSGVNTVVEAIGDHGCEYMTGGRVIVLGPTGRNFAAGMSGGIAYILDEKGTFKDNCNAQTVDLEKITDETEIKSVRELIEKHVAYTGSAIGEKVLKNFETYLPKFVRVIPKDYRRVLDTLKQVTAQGLNGEDAIMAAFEANKRDLSRVGGN